MSNPIGQTRTGANLMPKFDDPFLMPSSDTFPTELKSSFDFCLFLYYLNPLYVSTTNRVFTHFLTELVIKEQADGGEKLGDKSQQDRLKAKLEDTVNIWGLLQQTGVDWACFSGDTAVQTEEGVFKLRDVAGRELNVLGEGGKFRPAKFLSFGKQELMRVTLVDGSEIYATPEHEWVVKNGAGKMRRLPTRDLCLSHKLPRAAAATRPEEDEDYVMGVRHGFVYGDGSCYNKYSDDRETMSSACFFGDKDAPIMKFFEGHPSKFIERQDKDYKCIRQNGHPGHYKDLPSSDETRSYWLGFVRGFLAADGSVDARDGSVVLTQHRREVLEAISEQAPRLGMHVGKLCGPIERGPRVIAGREVGPSEMYHLHLLRNFMQEDDFLIEEHRRRFNEHHNPESTYGKFVGIQSISHTGRYEEVFCCQEMDTHTMSVGNGIVTGNCYGNTFMKVNRPFDRHVILPGKNGSDKWVVLSSLPRDKVKYNADTLTYTVPSIFEEKDDNGNVPEIEVAFKDLPSRNVDNLSFTFLDPRYIVLDKPHFGNKVEIVYKVPPDVVARIKAGNLNEVNHCTELTLRAVRDGDDIRYNMDEVFHFKQPTVTGLSESGWGIPQVIAHYRDLYQCQIYRKIDEVIAKDYLMPMRIFSPEFGPQTGGKGTPGMQIAFHAWRKEVAKMIEKRRVDKFAIHTLPTPVKYDEIGANGKQYSPKELVEIQNATLMDGIGYPQDLHRGSLQVQQMPTALRLFEKQYFWLFKGLNDLTKFIAEATQRLLGEARMDVGISRPMLADNLETSAMFTQLAMGGEFPREDAWKRFGVDNPREAYKRRVQEDMAFEDIGFEAQQDMQQKRENGSMSEQIAMQQAQQQGPPMDPNTGQPVAGAPGPGAMSDSNPLDVQGEAQQLAQEWLPLPEGERRKMLAQVKASNPTLHASIKEELENIRSQGASEGRAAIQQPQQ